MSGIALKVIGVALFGIAAVVGPPLDRLSLGILTFGILNLLIEVQGTRTVRMVAVAASLLTLVQPEKVFIAALGCLIWPPAFLLAWSNASGNTYTYEADGPLSPADIRARGATTACIIAVGLASLAYRAILLGRLDQTAALFIGVPAILAIVVTLGVTPRSAVGVACKAVTVGLLASLVLLWEGILCVALSAPLFYAVAISIGAIIERSKNRPGRPARSTHIGIVALVVLPLSAEGVVAPLTVARDEQVVVTRVVHAPIAVVRQATLAAPRFERPLPSLLRIGFPRPITARIDVTGPRPRWIVQMRGGEMRLNGMEPRVGDLVLELEASSADTLRWRALDDDSHMTHFLRWRETTVQLEAIDGDNTRVACIMRYDRRLDPAWYFGPLERYAATLAAGYLVESVATP